MPRALYANNARADLSVAIDDTETTVVVSDGSLFPAISGGNYAYVTIEEGAAIEIVKVTARSTDTLTVTRAQDGTTAQSFTTAAKVSLRLPKVALDEIHEVIDGRTGVSDAAGSTFNFEANAAPVYVNGTHTGTLPASPATGDRCTFISGPNLVSLAFARNGNTIEGEAEDMVMSTVRKKGGVMYDGTTWRVF